MLMKIELAVGDIRKHRADMIVVNLFEGTKSPGGSTGAVDKAIGGAISAAIRDRRFQGKGGGDRSRGGGPVPGPGSRPVGLRIRPVQVGEGGQGLPVSGRREGEGRGAGGGQGAW